MRKYLISIIKSIIADERIVYSLYEKTLEGERPLNKAFETLNPPKAGQLIALVTENEKDKKIDTYKIISVAHIYNSINNETDLNSKNEGTILVQSMNVSKTIKI